MRFRLIGRCKAASSTLMPPAPKTADAPTPPKASDLDNPYGRYYGKARSREDLKKR